MRRLHLAARRLATDRRANFATMTAFLVPAGIALAAFAIDAGALYTERRELQSVADLAAIAAASNVATADLAVTTTLADNGVTGVVIGQADRPRVPGKGETIATIQRGRYARAIGTAVTKRFVPNATPYNAVEVTLQTLGRLHFGESLIPPPELSAKGVASASAKAAFSVGSRLLKLEGGIANALLSGLLGADISLSVMDYEALVKADVGLFDFLDVLATDLKLKAATYDEVLATDVKVGAIASALAKVPGLDGQSKLALRALGVATDPKLELPLGKLVDLGPAGYLSLGGRPTGLAITASALQLLTGSAAIANGKNQVALDLGASVPGLLSATVALAIGEPPQHSGWLAIGETGHVIRTAQTRLLLSVELGGVAGTALKLPLYVELAFAEASLSDIQCRNQNPNSVNVAIAARPGVAEARIGELNIASMADFDRTPTVGPTKLLKTPLAAVTGYADVKIAQIDPKTLEFARTDIDDGTIKSVSTTNIATSLTKSLLDDLDLKVQVAGLDVGVSGPLKSTVVTALAAAAPAIDKILVGLLSTLGVTIGEADVRVHGAVCGRPLLVQ